MATTTTDRRSGSSSAGPAVDRATAASSGAGFKAPAKVATTASISLSALQTIDGVTLVANDRVLVKDQSTTSQNGIYVASSGNWERAPDWDDSRDVVEGTRVWVTDGTTNGQKEFVVTTADPIVPGTTSVTIVAAVTLTGYLVASANLSDLASAATARTNLGLGNVNNTSDANKPVSTAQQAALDLKASITYVDANFLPKGSRTLAYFLPRDSEPPSTNFAEFDLVNFHPVLLFDQTTAWSAIFTFQLPRDYTGGGITVYVTAIAAVTSGTMGWTVAFERMDSATDIDSDSFASDQTITAATVPATSGAPLTLSLNVSNGANMDNAAAGDLCRIKLTRDVTNDTAAGTVSMLSLEIRET